MTEEKYQALLNQLRKQKGVIMCDKLKKLNGLTAEQILEAYGETEPPVDIEKILRKMGVKYGAFDFSEIEKSASAVVEERGHILGAVTVLGEDIAIIYSENSTENRRRFTLAHELAHCCQNAAAFDNEGHIEFRFDEYSEHPAEIAANVFAGKLLIPKDALMKKYNELIVPLSDTLAREFRVSVHVMEERLKYLQLPFYSPNSL